MNNIQHDKVTNERTDISSGRLHVSFTVTGKDLNPDDLTIGLRITPSLSFRCGDIKTSSNGEKQKWEHGCWSIDSDDEGFPSNDPMPHFDWLLGMLEPVQEELKEILGGKDIDSRVSCFWITPDGRINLEINPNFLLRFAKLNVKIWFDIYCGH